MADLAGATLACWGIIYFIIERWHDREAKLALTGEQLARANRLIRRYVPVQLAEKILAGEYGTTREPERRKVTLFFSDVVGRKPTLLISSLAFLAAYLLFFFGTGIDGVPIFVVFTIAQVLLGAGMAFHSGTDASFHYRHRTLDLVSWLSCPWRCPEGSQETRSRVRWGEWCWADSSRPWP